MTIKEARKAAGLTQKQMSDLFEIPQRTIEAWEAGDRTPTPYVDKLIVEKLERLASESE
jgi:DNA-binding transcriptional regulator YiaG